MIDIEKLSNLPERLPMVFPEKPSASKYKEYGKWKRGRNTWTIAERIIKNNIGKSFAMAFSYFCSKVSIDEQRVFLENFVHRKPYYRRWANYCIDENGNIQYANEYFEWKNRPTKPITIPSPDYKTEIRHKETGIKKPEYLWIYNKTHPALKEEDFIPVVISGYLMTFESKQDPRFVRIFTEKKKARRKTDRFLKKEDRNREYSFLTKTEKELLAQKQQDLIKRDSHGFDDQSFKGIEYHGQKRKLK